MLMKLMMLCGGALMGIAMAAQVEWMQDLEKASTLAKAQNKLLLVEFTGSDWCRACLIQKKRVLSQLEFEEWVQKHCIAVEVDVPHDVKRVGGHAQKQKNEKICEAYDIKNFPSLMLMTPDKIMVGGYRGAHRSPEAAIAALEEHFSAVDKLKQAQAKKGSNKAKALKAIYDTLPSNDQESRFLLLEQIVAADSANTLGVQAAYRARLQMRQLKHSMLQAASPAAQLVLVDQAMAVALPENEAAIRSLKGNVLREMAVHLTAAPKNVQDIEKARDLLLESIEYIPTTREQDTIRKYVNLRYADPTALYKRIKRSNGN